MSTVIHSHEQAVMDIERMLKVIDKPINTQKKKINSRLQVAIDTAIEMSVRDNKEHVVVDQGNDIYQIWPKSVVEKCGCAYVKLEDYQCG